MEALLSSKILRREKSEQRRRKRDPIQIKVHNFNLGSTEMLGGNKRHPSQWKKKKVEGTRQWRGNPQRRDRQEASKKNLRNLSGRFLEERKRNDGYDCKT